MTTDFVVKEHGRGFLYWNECGWTDQPQAARRYDRRRAVALARQMVKAGEKKVTLKG